jgi:hypothetical protein
VDLFVAGIKRQFLIKNEVDFFLQGKSDIFYCLNCFVRCLGHAGIILMVWGPNFVVLTATDFLYF